MDPVTHGLIGATASQSFAKKETFRATAFTGFAAAMLADVDVFISSASDPLLNIELHRQFTHSLLFVPVGALVSSVLVWWFVRKYLSPKEVYMYSLAGYATAGITDYMTSYGVHLLWPFADERFSLDIISVFDPLFTLAIILLTGFAFYKKDKIYSFIAFGWILLYLGFGFTQQQKAKEITEQFAAQNGHQIEQIVVKPTIANQLLWSARYVSKGHLHTLGIRLTPFSGPMIYEGETASLFSWKDKYSEYQGTTLYEDIQRFSKLSNDILIKHPDHENVIGDGRYSMLPTTLSPLWGIEIDTTRPDMHVEFGTYRDANAEVSDSFLDMLLGRKTQ